MKKIRLITYRVTGSRFPAGVRAGAFAFLKESFALNHWDAV